EPPPCARAPASADGWRRVSAGPATLPLPPGYAADPSAPADSGEIVASWSTPSRAPSAPAGRIVLQVGRRGPEAGSAPQDSGGAGPRDARSCVLTAGGRTGTLSTVWFSDPTSATGRSYQTVARWEGLSGGRAAVLFMVSETPADQARQQAAASALRIR
ncbi:MAG: hypothetical protein JWM27_5080, partial [Gemmatimonadetes bacterium]|nr:hypothetical protein [Gemmatimonadota bacterium]